jgi:Na+-driven multidrug efflux pump/anti-sigma regulatory factor (Ser/Thr protein kinase)
MEKRNSYLTDKAFKIYLGASILTALSSMLGNIVDSIIVSNLVSSNAMSAVSLARPVIQLYYTVYLLFGLGGSLLVAYAFGKNDRSRANGIFSLVAWVLIAISAVMIAVDIIAPQAVVSLICTSTDVYPYAMEYMRPVMWGCFLYMGSFFFGTYTTLDGKPKLVSVAMITDNVVNLCLDLLFIRVFDWGTAGSSLATNCGHLVGIAIMASHYVGGRASYRLLMPRLNGMMHSLGEIAKSGAPFAVASICLTIYMYSANIIIQNQFGAGGIFIFSVMLSLLTFYNFFLSGACNTLQSLGALLVGLGDMQGLRLSVKAAFRFLVISLLICCGILWTIPGYICELFGCPADLLAECCYATRVYAAAFILFCVIYLLMVCYKLLGESALSNFISFALSLSVVPVIWIIAIYFPRAIWWSNLIAYTLVLAILLVWAELKRDNGKSHITLLPTSVGKDILDFSSPYSADGLGKALTSVSDYLKGHGVEQKRATAMMLSAEELLKNIIQHNETRAGKSEKRYIDIRLAVDNDGQQIILSLRDDGHPFDPTAARREEGKYGLLLATGFNQKMTYKYMFGQNLTTIEV